MFFARRNAPLQLRPEHLRSLQLSLNTPVVRTEDFPVAPARAALVVHAVLDGPLDVTLSVRSLKSGQVLHFAPDGDVPDAASCVDAAMAFGEGMGFLFDDDELAAGDAERAYGIWAELMGDLAPPPSEPAPADDAGTDKIQDEFLLVEAVVPEPEIEPPDTSQLTSLVEDALAAAEPAGAPEGEAPSPPATELSKFRIGPPAGATPLGEADPPLEADADLEFDLPAPSEAFAAADPMPEGERRQRTRRRLGKAALGKLRLVKKRKPVSDEERRDWLARILSSF